MGLFPYINPHILPRLPHTAKTRNKYPTKQNMDHSSNNTTTKKLSLSILILSLPLLYISLLHIPTSSLLGDTTFMFLIFNSIIFIVATDSGVFSSPSSSKESNTLDVEYIKHNKALVKVQEPSNNANYEKEVVLKKTRNGRSRQLESLDPPAVEAVAVGEERRRCGREESDYWKMSDEELNERVEEFIRRVNREIRLQERRIVYC